MSQCSQHNLCQTCYPETAPHLTLAGRYLLLAGKHDAAAEHLVAAAHRLLGGGNSTTGTNAAAAATWHQPGTTLGSSDRSSLGTAAGAASDIGYNSADSDHQWPTNQPASSFDAAHDQINGASLSRPGSSSPSSATAAGGSRAATVPQQVHSGVMSSGPASTGGRGLMFTAELELLACGLNSLHAQHLATPRWNEVGS